MWTLILTKLSIFKGTYYSLFHVFTSFRFQYYRMYVDTILSLFGSIWIVNIWYDYCDIRMIFYQIYICADLSTVDKLFSYSGSRTILRNRRVQHALRSVFAYFVYALVGLNFLPYISYVWYVRRRYFYKSNHIFSRGKMYWCSFISYLLF